MALHGSKDVAFFLVGGYDVVGTLTEIEDEGVEAITERTDTFGDAWEENSFVGVRKWGLSQKGFFDDAAGSVHSMLSTGPGVSRVLCYALEGTATGKRFIGAAGALQIDYKRIIARGELHKAEAAYRGTGPVDLHGKIVRMWNLNSATGATTGTPLDGVASSTGGAAYLQYGTPTANTEANVRMLHSSDNITYGTLFTFAKLSILGGGAGAERMTTTGVIERYTAYDVTTASATGNITVLSTFLGLARGGISS